jgi:hypothetical protein
MHTPKTLDLVGKYFAKNPDAMWLSGDYTIINERGKKIQSWIVSYKRLFRSFSSFQTLAIVNYIPQPSTFWRRELMENIGYYDESLHLVLDYDYWLRAIQKYPLHKTSSSLSFFRIHGQAKGTADYQKQFTDSYKIIKRYTNSPILLILHKVHALLTIIAYKILK